MKEKREYGIAAGTMEKIIAVFRDDPHVDKVILFGSRAKGTNSPGSDIDLAITGSSLNLDDLLQIHLELDALSLPYKFDVVIYDRIREKALKDHIDRRGIVLYDRKLTVKQESSPRVADKKHPDYGQKKA